MPQQSGVDYRVAVGMTGMMLFDELGKAVAETTRSLGTMTAEISRTTQSLNNAGGASRNLRSDMGGVATGANEAGGGVERLTGMLYELAAAAGIAFSIDKLVEWNKEVMNVTAEMQGYDNRIKFASLDTDDASKNMAFLKKEVNDLHLPIKGVYEGFSQMEAGLMGTGIEGEKLRKLVWGIGEAAATVHLNEQDMSGTLLSLKEIGEVGLNMRLEKMLIRNLPGVGNAVRQAFGKSMSELEKDGITGPQFLEKLGPALDAYYKSGVANYSKSLQASMVDTSNLIYTQQVEVGEKLESFYKDSMSSMRGFIKDIGADAVKALDWIGAHKEDLKTLGKEIAFVAGLYVGYQAAVKGCVLWTKAMAMWNGVVALADTFLASQTALVALGYDGLTASVMAATAAMELNPIGLIVAGVVGLGAALYHAWQNAEDMNAEFDKTGKKIIWDPKVAKLDMLDLQLKGLADAAKIVGLSFQQMWHTLKGDFKEATLDKNKIDELTKEYLAIQNGTYGQILPGQPGYTGAQGEKGAPGLNTHKEIIAAAEGNKIRNVIITIEKMIGVENMSYDQHKHDPRHIEQAISNMLVNSTRDAEIALGRD